MATRNIKIKRNNNGTEDTLHPETSWGQLTDVPSTFTPTAHTHSVSDITDASLDPRLFVNDGATGDLWRRVAKVNNGSGGVTLRGSLSNHVESFGTQNINLTI